MYDVPDFIVGCEGEDLIVNGDLTLTYVLEEHRTMPRELKLKESFKKFLLQVKGFDRIFIVMGNHEHYHGDIKRSKELLENYMYDVLGLDPEKYMVLENRAVELDDNTVLLGATLWTDMRGNDDVAHYFVGRGMNDFRVINNGPNHRWTTQDAYVEHKNTLAWMTEQLEKYKDKRVIITTHHCPSYQSNCRYEGSTIRDGYCSNLEQFILDHPQITNWIHGHTHVNVDYKIGECRVTSNMRGYVDHDLYVVFDAKTFQERVVEY